MTLARGQIPGGGGAGGCSAHDLPLVSDLGQLVMMANVGQLGDYMQLIATLCSRPGVPGMKQARTSGHYLQEKQMTS